VGKYALDILEETEIYTVSSLAHIRVLIIKSWHIRRKPFSDHGRWWRLVGK